MVVLPLTSLADPVIKRLEKAYERLAHAQKILDDDRLALRTCEQHISARREEQASLRSIAQINRDLETKAGRLMQQLYILENQHRAEVCDLMDESDTIFGCLDDAKIIVKRAWDLKQAQVAKASVFSYHAHKYLFVYMFGSRPVFVVKKSNYNKSTPRSINNHFHLGWERLTCCTIARETKQRSLRQMEGMCMT